MTANCGQVEQAVGNEEAWTQMRLEQYRTTEGTHEQYLGGNRWVLASERRTKAGGLVGTRTDISKIKQADEALRESEERMRMVADGLPALTSYVDTTLHYRFANKSFEQWYGVDAEDVVGMPVRDVMGDTFFDRVAHRFEAVLAGQEVNYDDSFEYEEGRVRYFRASYIPHFGKSGEVLCYFALTTTSPKESRPKRNCASPRNRPTPPTGPSHCSSPT